MQPRNADTSESDASKQQQPTAEYGVLPALDVVLSDVEIVDPADDAGRETAADPEARRVHLVTIDADLNGRRRAANRDERREHEMPLYERNYRRRVRMRQVADCSGPMGVRRSDAWAWCIVLIQERRAGKG